MSKRKPPQPDMNIFLDEHSWTMHNSLTHIAKENDIKSPTHIVDGEYIKGWGSGTEAAMRCHKISYAFCVLQSEVPKLSRR